MVFKLFEIYLDANDFAIGIVSMLEEKPIAFESRKLIDVEQWPPYEK